MSVQVLVRYEGRARKDARARCVQIRTQATRMLGALALPHAELSVLLCDDRVMHRLNSNHRGIDRPTDVLAFAMREGMPIAAVHESLGDIAIALPTAARQARQHGCPFHLEACLLLAHGLLHLLGYDHATRMQERRMMARTHLLMAAGLARSRRVDKLR
jgi:probable rRNA maturation factor